MSNPRPIHTLHKKLREDPDESEPSYSYEETSFLAQKEDDVEDEFHRRFLASTTAGGGGGNGTGRSSFGSYRNSNLSASNNNSGPVQSETTSTTISSTTTGRGSFWRTEATPQWKPRGGSNHSGGARTTSTGSSTSMGGTTPNNRFNTMNKRTSPNITTPYIQQQQQQQQQQQETRGGVGLAAAGMVGGSPSIGSGGKKEIPKRERKTSGGLLGAALQLHSQGNKNRSVSNTSDHDKTLKNTCGDSTPQQQQHKQARFVSATPKRSSSNLSQNSSSSAEGGKGSSHKKDLTKQRAEARRLKLDAQLHDVDIGRLETAPADNDIHNNSTTSGPARGLVGTPLAQSTLVEEDEGGMTTDDGDSTTASQSNSYNNNSMFANNAARYPQHVVAVEQRSNSITPPPPVATISTGGPGLSTPAGLDDNTLPMTASPLPLSSQQHYQQHEFADSRSVASGDGSLGGVGTGSISSKSLLYGKAGSISVIHHPSQQVLHPPVGTGTSGSNLNQNTGSGSSSNSASRPGIGGGVLFGKSSSLIFPTGVIDSNSTTPTAPLSSNGSTAATSSASGGGVGAGSGALSRTSSDLKHHKINLLLDQCETVRFPFKKKLMLNSLDLTAADIPVKDLYGTNLGNSLHKLSLAGNRLSTVPPKLVTCLPILKTLDLSQCELHQLPDRWNLPQLKRLNLSHNRLTDFPEETMLEGLLELQELNMYGNKVSMIVVPHNPKLLAKLETLNLGYNDLAYIPEDLDRLKALRTLKVMNNFLEKIPMRVCDMELKSIDVSSNPVIQPPIETCERGICSMKRYYQCLRMEEQSKQKALEALQSKAARHSKKSTKQNKVGGVSLGLNFTKPKRMMQVSLGRKTSDDSNSNNSSVNLNEPQPMTSLQIDQKAAPSAQLQATSNSRSISLQAEHLPGASSSTIPPLTADERPKSKSLTAVDENQRLASAIPGQDPKIETAQNSQIVGRSAMEKLSTWPDGSLATEVVQDPSSNKFTIDSDRISETSLKTVDFASAEMMEASGIDQITVNDTLKVIFVGMAMAGKTSMIKRLIEGENAVIPKRDERTVGVDIYEWDPKIDKRFEHIDSRIQLQDKELEELCGDVNVKFSVWDFAGQHVYHATHELFFSPRALYVLVWDMGATNIATKQRRNVEDDDSRGAFKLTYDSDGTESEDDDDFVSEEEARRADRALERDIDEKVQFWVDCIQSSAPGAAILPVASFDDLFEENNHQEAKRRCNILKQRLLRHEARRIQGIKDRLKEYVEQNRANDEAALRLRKLLGSYTRPKIIFGNDDEDSVVRVSGKKYTGFAKLTERINNIATGRDKANFRYPIFRGHVGARIPRMRLEVREAVRRMRDRFKVVEWGYFINELGKDGLTSVEDISDALHFLTNIGELSYFGGILPGRPEQNRINPRDDLNSFTNTVDTVRLSNTSVSVDASTLSEDEDDEEGAFLSIDDTSITMPTTEDGSLSTLGDALYGGLSQFVFLNPRWLVAAVACILRHDLDREIQETRRSMLGHQRVDRSDSFYEANMNCPVITADDACMLWQAKKFTKKAAERAVEYSNNMTVKPFEFLQLLLIRFGVFVPIDLGIEKAFLGGIEYSRRISNESQTPEMITVGGPQVNSALQATYFFLPSLLGPGEPAEAWTYKSTDSWKATLCHSVLFPDGVPPGLMERITASVLSNLYSMTHQQGPYDVKDTNGLLLPSYEGNVTVKEVLCWRTAFLVKLGMKALTANGVSNNDQRESIVEIFTALVDRDSHLCVGSDFMSVGSRRLITSAKGQEGDGGRKIWKGGYLVVLKAVQKVMEGYGGLEYEKQGFCPECMSKKAVGEASSWDLAIVRSAVCNGESTIRCRHGHRVDTRLVSGPNDNLQQNKGDVKMQTDPVVPINDLLRGVVVVGLWDGRTRKVVRVGSGFIADKKRGLIVTAAHTLMNIWGDKSTPFGENYYGLRQGKVVIGIIPRKKGEDSDTEAVFRYFAKIVAKDPDIDNGVCHLDACVLRITTRMENDVTGTGEGCGDQPERLLLNNPPAIKQEKFHQLKVTDKCELDEQVRIVGYNQGGEGLMGPGVRLNRYVDFARGYVCKKFAGGEGGDGELRHRFKPREEIVVICPTIGGHSGGPCVNQQGEVIGILSRADPAESQRCYLVPAYEWRALLREAKNTL